MPQKPPRLPGAFRSAAWLAGLLAVACRQPAPDLLATWEGGEARVADLEAFVRALPDEERRPEAGDGVEDWVRDGLARMALQETLAARAAAAGVERDPVVGMRARYLASLEIGRRFVAERCPAPELSEAELRRLFEQRAQRQPGEWILVRHIYKRVAAATSAAERARVRSEMEGLLDQLRAGASFVEMARRHSQSETAADGGLIGRISRHPPMEPEFAAAAWTLADGELSEVVELANGFHIILREDSGVEEAPPSFEAAAPALRREVVAARREACGQRLLAEIGAELPVSLPEAGLPVDPQPGDPMLKVGDETFTFADLEALVHEGGSLAGSPVTLQLMKQLGEALLLTAAARREPELEAAYLEREAALRRQLAVERQWRSEREALVAARPEEELRRFFDEHRGEFRSETRLELGLILLASGPQRSPRDTQELAAQLAARARGGESFEDLARRHSEHPTGREGGGLGLLPWSRVRVLFGRDASEAAGELAVGAVSDPVVLARLPTPVYGVVRLVRRDEPRERSFEEARDDVVAALLARRVNDLDAELRQRILADIDFSVVASGVERYLASVRGESAG